MASLVGKVITHFCVLLLSLKGQFSGFAYVGFKGRILCFGHCAALTPTVEQKRQQLKKLDPEEERH